MRDDEHRESVVPELEAQRAELYARLAELGDFRRGSVSENYRRCGKPNCVCARRGIPGTAQDAVDASWADGKTVGRQLTAGEVDKVRRELAAYHAFAQLSDKIVAVNEAICEARVLTPVPETGGRAPDAGTTAKRGALRHPPGSVRDRDSRLAELDPDSTSYLATLEPVDHFADLLQAEAAAAATTTSANSSSSATAPAGSGTSPTALPRPRPDRGPLPRPRTPARTRRTPRVHRARPRRLARRPAHQPRQRRHRRDRARRPQLPLVGVKAAERDKDLAYVETTPTACATPTTQTRMFVGSGVVEAAAKPSSVPDSNDPACTGQHPAPPPSPPCAATTPANPATSPPRHDQPPDDTTRSTTTAPTNPSRTDSRRSAARQ